MGSGKSTVGKHLAVLLNLRFIDLDNYIEEGEKMPVPKIFEQKGELYFRKKEHSYLAEIVQSNQDFVLATGGGTPCYGNNLNTILSGTDNVFYLKLSISELAKRLSKEKQQRPLIKNITDEDLPEFIGKHLFERNLYYGRAAHPIECDNRSPDEVAEEIGRLSV